MKAQVGSSVVWNGSGYIFHHETETDYIIQSPTECFSLTEYTLPKSEFFMRRLSPWGNELGLYFKGGAK